MTLPETVNLPEIALLLGVSEETIVGAAARDSEAEPVRPMMLTRPELARLLSVSETTVSHYVSKGMPGIRDDQGNWKFDAYQSCPWVCREWERQAREGTLRR